MGGGPSRSLARLSPPPPPQLIKGAKKGDKALEKMDLINERTSLRDAWMSAKGSARSNIKLLRDGLDVLKEKELRDIQEEFREVDGEFRALGVLVEKESLFEGAAERGKGKDKFDPKRATNDDLLGRALNTETDTLAKLKAGLATVESTKEQGKYTAAQLEQDREKLKRIDAGLDEAQSELQMSTVLITRFAKRMATDKIVIAFAFILVMGLVGIIVYASLNPNQKIFNVPSVAMPPVNAAQGAACGTGLVTCSPTPSPTRGPPVRLLRGWQ
jgi:hypothetical protein